MSRKEQTVDVAEFAKHLGLAAGDFANQCENPANFAVFKEGLHSDNHGFEAQNFAHCFQEVREKHGPYVIFGSKQTQDVTSCMNRWANAWKQAVRAQQQ